MPFEKLDSDERQAVMEKARSIAQAVREFDRSKIKNVQNTFEVIALLPQSKEALGERMPGTLPGLPPPGVTPENLASIIEEHGLAATYLLVMKQLDASMGSPEEEGFLGEMQTFSSKVNDTIDVHLEVADALNEMGDNWMRLALLLLAVAGVAGGTGDLAPQPA